MNANNQVGSNAGKVVPQLCTPFVQDLYAPVGGGDVVFDAATLLANLVAQGMTHQDAANTAVTTTDIIYQIKASLKPDMGDGESWNGAGFDDVVATTCQAEILVNGTSSDIDPSGSRDFEGQIYANAKLPAGFTSVTVAEGSIVTVSGVICQPAA